MSLKSLKTPLRYPGGKSRAAKYLVSKMPDFKEYREPFIGGCSVAIEVCKQYPNADIWINDLYKPLYNFYVQLRDNELELVPLIAEFKKQHEVPDKASQLFDEAKEGLESKGNDAVLRAAYFYIINKCSFSGLTMNSSFSRQASNQNFSLNGIYKLTMYSEMMQGWKITNLSYEKLLGGDAFVFMDPPYNIKDFLYGKKGNMHKGFNHNKFAKDCNESTNKWMVTYNSNEYIRKLFDGHTMQEWDLTYTMRSTGSYNLDQSKRKELLITNYEQAQLPFN